MFWRPDDLLATLRLNQFVTTQMIGPRACVFVGPKGANVDVVAHELVHAGVFDRVGPWVRMMQIPVWFDEGLAMQVDHRDRYALPDNPDTAYVRHLNSPADFFVSDQQSLSCHYASAKVEVARWLNAVGTHTVYGRLARRRSGESFSRPQDTLMSFF